VEDVSRKRKMNLTMTQHTKAKGKAKEGSSIKKNNPIDNTREAAAWNQPSGSSAVPKIPRRTTTMPRMEIQEDSRKRGTSQTGE
jgi:hypothetical protein